MSVTKKEITDLKSDVVELKEVVTDYIKTAVKEESDVRKQAEEAARQAGATIKDVVVSQKETAQQVSRDFEATIKNNPYKSIIAGAIVGGVLAKLLTK